MTPNQLLAACHAGDGGEWDIPFSLRFRSASLASLSRTPSVAGNRKTWTWSGWVKRGSLDSYQSLFSTYLGSSTGYAAIRFGLDNTLSIYDYTGVTYAWNLQTTQVFRDPSAWYHIQVAVDTTQPIATERVRLSVNGSRVSAFAAATYPTLNANTYTNNTTASSVGASNSGTASQYFDGYLAEVHFVDGQALDPSYFGQWSQESGQWTPIRYRGSYGTNGFYLDFKDASGITALGYDQSGQSNHWTPNNFSLTTGVFYDHMEDTPTNNFPVLLPISDQAALQGGSVTYAGLYTACLSGGNICQPVVSMKGTGKVYFEVTINPYSTYGLGVIGVSNTDQPAANTLPDNSKLLSVGLISGQVTQYGTYGCAVDFDAGNIWYRDPTNTWISGNPETNTAPSRSYVPTINDRPYVAAHRSFNQNSPGLVYVNFGQQPFAYTPPSGFNKLCSKNLPVPTIKRGETGFDIVIYTGNGGNIQVGEYQFPRPSYLIDKSLRFKGATLNCLNRTPASAGNQTNWTWSGWIKATNISSLSYLFSAGVLDLSQAYFTGIRFYQGRILLADYRNLVTYFAKESSRIINDSNWHHIVAIFDSQNAVVANRAIIYIDGIRQTVFNASTDVPLNYIGYINGTNLHRIGEIATGVSPGGGQYFQGYMAEINFIDGQALDPSSFGEYDINGYWIPKAYTGSYGQNGFYLDFEDTSAVANLGFDKSGLGNNWSVNNFSLTAGVTYDSMLDSPTANYAIMDPLTSQVGNKVFSNGGLTVVTTANSAQPIERSVTYVSSGKWYWEVTATFNIADYFGVCNRAMTTYTSNSMFFTPSGLVWINGGYVSGLSGGTYASGDTLGIALNMDNRTISLYKNGVLGGTVPIGNLQDAVTAFAFTDGASNTATNNWNFGQRPFTYTPPEGYKALSIPNIAEYTEDLESPDLVWIKCRNAAQNHMLFDSIRGATKYLSSNLTAVEATDVNSLISFNKNGFYLGNNANVNTLNNTYVAWMWKASQQQVTNNAGSIESQVRANVDAGFSVVKYTGNGVESTIGHGLGVKPSMIIIKNLSVANDWVVGHEDLFYTIGFWEANYHARLNNGYGLYISDYVWSGDTTYEQFTSSVFRIGTSTLTNTNGNDYVAYCFAEVEGFSKFGKYIGNGLADGPFIFCNGSPRFILIKRAEYSASSDWYVWDRERDSLNPLDAYLLTDTTAAETGSICIDALSNGFKLRSAIANVNGGVYIFAAFMENPFKYSIAK